MNKLPIANMMESLEDKLPTNLGMKTPTEIVSHLMYSSYKANRGYGMTHEALVRIGVGNDAMKLKYESEKN